MSRRGGSGRLTAYPFNDDLRRDIAARLSSFDVVRRAVPKGVKHAAVAITLVPVSSPGEGAGAPEAGFLLTRRASKLSAHGGQLALPGGRLDPNESVEQAALRELSE